MSKPRPALNDIEALLSTAVREQMLEDIAANDGAEVLWWGKLRPLDSDTGSDSGSQNPLRETDQEADKGESGQTASQIDSQINSQANFQVGFVEAAACGNEDSVLGHFPYMERGDVVLHNHPSGLVQPSEADMAVAGELAMQGIGFYIVDNRLSRICVVAKPVLEAQEQALDLERLSALLGPDGPLAQRAREKGGEYEQRPTQQQLLRLVGSGFNQDKIIVAEGGTGIGKSFAYLLPAAFWAVRNKQRVVVSTATINLQQQLIEKDIPLIREISGLDELQTELVKGRSNYLCLRRLKQTEDDEGAYLGLNDGGEDSEGGLFRTELANIKQWSAVTQDGSLSDLSFRPQSGVWNQVCGESDNCLGLRCEFHEKCFIIQARRRAAAAHILVVNHHLLFADLELRGGDFGYEKTAVLPPYRHVVLDEAHNIERSAQSFFSENLSRFSAQRSLRRLYFKRHNRESGIWAQLRRHAELEVSQADDLPDILAHSETVEQTLEVLDDAAKRVLDSAQNSPGSQKSRQSNSLRIPEQWQSLPPQVQQALNEQLWPQLQQLRTALQNLIQALRQVYELLESVLEGEEYKLLLEWRKLARRLEGLRDSVLHWIDRQQQSQEQSQNQEQEQGLEMERVFWLEKRQRGSHNAPQYYQRLVSTQVNIGDLLQQVLYQPMRSVILLSATLTVRGRFDYWCSRVGLGELLAECTSTAKNISSSNGESTDWQADSPIWEEDYAQFHPSQTLLDSDSAGAAGDGENEEGGEMEKPLLNGEQLSVSIYASPFDYRNRVHLLLASDAPNPSFSQDFDSYIARFAQQALRAIGGRSLLLFTSYASLHKCYQFLQEDGVQDLIRQGDDDSARLLQRFKEQESLSLLATDSFWEGVDAPGATLTQVLLCRLPFRSPDDPIVAAHMEYLERKGENAFFHYSLPEAVLRFRQGFGRLMRRSSDCGLVVVLDPRIVSKRYGQDFLDSLPPARIVRGDFAALQSYIEDYAAANSHNNPIL